MSTNDTSWGDGGFGSDDDSFAGMPPKPSEQTSHESASQPVVPNVVPPVVEPIVRRIELPRPAIAPLPPPVPPKRRGGMFWTSVIAATLLIVAIGGSIVWYATKPDAEEELLYAPDDEPMVEQQENATPVDTQQVTVVDTPLVVRDEAKQIAQQPTPKPERQIARQEAPPVMKKETPPVVKKEAPPVMKREPASPKAPNITTSTPPSTKAKPLFVVQVFSSPSKDDAEEWLQSLREKKVNDGYITEQQIKGQPWYRVRFGQYERREEAEAAAMNMGFTQPWVARIR